jgi:hypothetical protein
LNLNEGRSPQITNGTLGQWIQANYGAFEDPILRYSDYPENPVDGQIIYHTTEKKYYQYQTGNTPPWISLGPNYSHSGNPDIGILPTGGSSLEFYDTKSGNFANLFLVFDTDADSPNPMPAPLLMTDQGFIIKKDLMVGGLVDSGQGTLWLNYGLVGKPTLSSPPAIQLMSPTVPYPSGASFPDISPDWYEDGQLFNLTTSYYWARKNKLYQTGMYRWEGSGENGDWKKSETYTGHYDTLYLCKNYLSAPAHLDLGDLIAHGKITLTSTNSMVSFTAGDNFDYVEEHPGTTVPRSTYLIPQDLTPSQGTGLGTSTQPFLWVDTKYLFTDQIVARSGGSITFSYSESTNTATAAEAVRAVVIDGTAISGYKKKHLNGLTDEWYSDDEETVQARVNGITGTITANGLTIHGNAGVDGFVQFNNDAKLVWVNTSTLAVQDSTGSTNNGSLDAGSVFVNNLQPLNSGSPAGININCPLNIGGSRGTVGQVLISQGSGSSPVWSSSTWNGGTISSMITIANTTAGTYNGIQYNKHDGTTWGAFIGINNDDTYVRLNSNGINWQFVAGKVGIGGAPNYLLDVIGLTASIRAYDPNASTYTRLILQTANREWRIVNDGTNSNLLTFWSDYANTAATLDPTGNFTITGSMIFSRDKVVELLHTTGNGFYLCDISASSAGAYIFNSRSGYANGLPFWFQNQGTNILTISPSGDLSIKGGLYTINGVALNIAPDTNFVHTGTVYVNANSSNNGSTAFNLQCGGSTKGAFGFNANNSRTYVAAYTDSSLAFSELHLLGSKIVLENDTDLQGLVNINRPGSYPALNFQYSGNNKFQMGWGGTTWNNTAIGSNMYLCSASGGIVFDAGHVTGYQSFWFYGGDISVRGGYSIVPEGSWNSSGYYEGGFVGTGDYRWYSGYMRTLHTTGGAAYDEFDDLAIVKQWGEKKPKLPADYNGKLRPKDNDPFSMLRSKEGDDYFCLNDLVSFSLGCSKALAKKHDEHQETISAMYSVIEQLREKVAQLETKLAS